MLSKGTHGWLGSHRFPRPTIWLFMAKVRVDGQFATWQIFKADTGYFAPGGCHAQNRVRIHMNNLVWMTLQGIRMVNGFTQSTTDPLLRDPVMRFHLVPVTRQRFLCIRGMDGVMKLPPQHKDMSHEVELSLQRASGLCEESVWGKRHLRMQGSVAKKKHNGFSIRKGGRSMHNAWSSETQREEAVTRRNSNVSNLGRAKQKGS